MSGVLDVGARRVAMDDDWFVFHQCAVSFIVAPDTLRLWIGGRPSKHTPEHVQGSVDPAILVDGSPPITLDARDEQNDEDTLAPALQERSPSDGQAAPCGHFSINIDRQRWRGNRSIEPCPTSENEFPDAGGLPGTDTSDLTQCGRVSREDAFDGPEVVEQALRESRTDAW